MKLLAMLLILTYSFQSFSEERYSPSSFNSPTLVQLIDKYAISMTDHTTKNNDHILIRNGKSPRVSVNNSNIPTSDVKDNNLVDMERLLVWEHHKTTVIGILENHSVGSGSYWSNDYYLRIIILTDSNERKPNEIGRIYLGNEQPGGRGLANFKIVSKSPFKFLVEYTDNMFYPSDKDLKEKSCEGIKKLKINYEIRTREHKLLCS